MMFRKAASLIISAMLVASVSVASYGQQAYQFGKCEVTPANKEAEFPHRSLIYRL